MAISFLKYALMIMIISHIKIIHSIMNYWIHQKLKNIVLLIDINLQQIFQTIHWI